MNLSRMTTCLMAIALATFAEGEARAGLLFAAQGDFHTINGGNRVQQYDTTSSASQTFAGNLTYAQGLAIDSAGNLYVAETTANIIMRFTPSGVGSVFADGSDGLNLPIYLAFDSSGQLYVSNYGSGSISRFTPGGVGQEFAHLSAGSQPQGLAFDAAGNLYVANSNKFTIEKFNSAGIGTTFANVTDEPVGLAFDKNGNLYVSLFATHTIDKYSPGGERSFFGSTRLGPMGMAFDSHGSLFVATGGSQTDNAIMMFTSTGVGSVFAETGSFGNRDVAFSAVPEPGSLVVFSIGMLGLAGFRWISRSR